MAAVVLLAGLVFATPVAAASASSWRATIVGATLHGGATTLITSDGHGTINIKVHGVTPGEIPIALLMPSDCSAEAQQLLTFAMSVATSAGVSTGRHALAADQVGAYNAALSARIPLSILVVTVDDKGCGRQVGAPSVGTGRLKGTIAAVSATYDLRHPVVGGVDATVATAVNGVLARDAAATVAGFTQDATDQGPPATGAGPSTASQTFSVSLSQPTLLSVGNLFSQYNTGAAHPLTSLSTYTFDLATGHLVRLGDLFRPGTSYLTTISAESRIRLRTLLHDPSLNSLIDSGTRPTAANFQSWQLTAAGLRITFGQYQVGPYAIGLPAIVIPWASLRSILNLRSPVAALLPVTACSAGPLAGGMSEWEGGLGSRFNTVTLKNLSALACILQGTPQSQLIDGTGRVLLDSARAGASGLPHVAPYDPRVVIAAGASGRIDVRTTNYCGATPVAPVRIGLRLPGGGGRVVASAPPSGSNPDDVPPCFGPTAPGIIITNGWHHA